jgi:polar amino acid transport system substrate-binding protein
MKRLLLAAPLLLALSLPASAAPPPTQSPGVLVVGLNMPNLGFQVGAVRGTTVVFARGFEIDLAKALGRRLGVRTVTFYQEARFQRLISAGPKPWDLAIGEITITPARARAVDFSVPYLDADEGVLLRKGLAPAPTSLAGLRGLRLCSQLDTTSADTIATLIRPTTKPLLYGNSILLMQNLQTGRCDAVVYDAPILATLRAQVPFRYGPFAGVIATGEKYGITLPKGSLLTPLVNRALRQLIADGTVSALAKRWLTTDLSKLRVLG